MQENPRLSILIVENDAKTITFLKNTLQKEGYIIYVETDSVIVLERAKLLQPNLILLHELDLCRMLNEEIATTHIPIIMISNDDNGADVATSLNLGADDCLAKSYSLAELAACIRAVLRRSRPAFVHKVISCAGIEIDLDSHKVSYNSQEIRLTPIPYQILQILMSAPNRVFSREDLIHRIWNHDIPHSRVLEVHINKLRKALLQARGTGEDVIKTKRGVGYTIRSSIGL